MSNEFVNTLKAWVAEDAEGRVMTVVEDSSIVEYVGQLIEQLERAERENDALILNLKGVENLAAAAEARAQKAEAELRSIRAALAYPDESMDSATKPDAQRYWADRLAKAEAVVEAARQYLAVGQVSQRPLLLAALAALDEPPTRLGGIEGKHYAVGGRDAPPPVDEREQTNA